MAAKTYLEVNGKRVYARPDGLPSFKKRKNYSGTFTDGQVTIVQQWAAKKPHKRKITNKVRVEGTPHVTGKEDKLNVDLLRRLEAAGKAFGCTINIISGYRSPADQLRLWLLFLAGRGNPANRPGTSMHEKGEAVDAYIGGVPFWSWCDTHGHHSDALSIGLTFPHTNEAWHVERVR